MSKSRKVPTKKSTGLKTQARKLVDYPAFGMWADREDMKDVEAWLRRNRTPSYLRDGGTLFDPPKKAKS